MWQRLSWCRESARRAGTGQTATARVGIFVLAAVLPASTERHQWWVGGGWWCSQKVAEVVVVEVVLGVLLVGS